MKAIRTDMQTLVGFNFSAPYPQAGGNCFSVLCEDGVRYRVCNMHVENLNHLRETGVISYPLEVQTIGDKHCIVVDPRVPESYLMKRMCTICTPRHLLPVEQQEELAARDIGALTLSRTTTLPDGTKITGATIKLGFRIKENVGEGIVNAPYIPLLRNPQ